MKRPEVDAALAAAARSMFLAFEIISSHMRFTCQCAPPTQNPQALACTAGTGVAVTASVQPDSMNPLSSRLLNRLLLILLCLEEEHAAL